MLNNKKCSKSTIVEIVLISLLIFIFYIAINICLIHYKNVDVAHEYTITLKNTIKKLEESNLSKEEIKVKEREVNSINALESTSKEYKEFNNSSFFSKVKVATLGFQYIKRVDKTVEDFKKAFNQIISDN